MLALRPYQQAAVDAVYEHLRTRDDNPCIVIPTGGGKTPVIATICKDAVGRWDGRVLILAHVKELLEQTTEKLRLVCPEVKFGVYSAGLNRRDTEHSVIVAGIQSVYKRARELDSFDLVIVDECFVAGTRISTPAGDIPIEHVQPGMFVRNATGIGRVEAVAARPARSIVTLEYDDGTVLKCTPNHPIFTDSGWRAAGALAVGSLALGIEDVRMLRQDFSTLDQTAGGRESAGPKGKVVDKATVLFDLLREDLQQLHDLAGSPQASEQLPEGQGPLASHSWRERTTHEAATGDVPSPGSGLGPRIQCAGAELSRGTLAEKLENRPSQSGADDRIGTGWTQPPVAPAPARRFPQIAVPGAKRLVRVTHHEPAGGSVVFNLQISGHPTYFANGVLVHNCHMIPSDGEGMYRHFIADAKQVNPHLRVIGLTATPYRMKSGQICGPENILNAVCYEVGVRELVREGYLCPLTTKAGRQKVDTANLRVRGGEYLAGDVEDLMDQDALVEAACTEIVEYARDRGACLIFASGIHHGKHVVRVLAEQHDVECGFVCGETPDRERDEVLARFRGGDHGGLFERRPLKYLCNVNVLTTGFDAPNIDCVAMLRPTLSPGLYYQMVGRGFRMHPGKKDCLVLDFGGNVLRHGPVDQVTIKERTGDGAGGAPAKECPECNSVIAAGYVRCPDCGYEFPTQERQKHEAKAASAGILSGQVTTKIYDVAEAMYSVHIKRDSQEGDPRTMRVDYRIGWRDFKSEWICFEHVGYARQKAIAWWKQRSLDPVPDTAHQAVEFAKNGGIAETKKITVRAVAGEPYQRIVGYELGPIPEPLPAELLEFYEEEVPF